ncbi:unnamed protein product [Heligmosomoides polygyrus]|uniref:Geranylgeranyl transferase type-2 subunit alpha n=1 Tax=Heligmosomoides polygyrus TaxID=6339 RepID=A0A3P8B3Q1_HELPZ|nr:unnamed protein product [Heligmosomoides polygyrus]
MHFVKKVPTSDEEKAVKEKERAIKLKAFCTIRDKIFEKRGKGELDDEILSLTQKLLEKNPDIYTFWNIRRETIEKKIQEWKNCEVSLFEGCKRKIENLLTGELFLTQECLEENHKSYAAWFHRGWALKRQENPDIKRDLALCEKALKLDCRNFHTFDHRRLVAKLGSLGDAEELEFSNRLIAQNFSNYSAWHYRAVLLPRIQNAETGTFTLSDGVIANELKKATSAFFTDPEDQSAWVYSRWLFEMGSNKEFLRSDSDSPAVPLSVSFHGNNTTVVMSKPCTLNEVLSLLVCSPEWARYMYTLCLIETRPDECHEEILKNLDMLATELDVRRKEIYKKLASRQILNRILCEGTRHTPLLERLMDGDTDELSIRNEALSSLDGVELLAGLVKHLDVSGNELSSLSEVLLPNLEYLTANENPIKEVSPTETLSNLKFLSLGACQLEQPSSVVPALKAMPSLERFLYCETPLCQKTEEIARELPSVRLIPYYL